ncbi:hypothetical protein F5Y16DRAFT_394704 [Xylariaceae sp. FL0255]|nr:hypothetical protein F5Y16DRAFT_394704 [Xylariaceae sp. FL0255]
MPTYIPREQKEAATALLQLRYNPEIAQQKYSKCLRVYEFAVGEDPQSFRGIEHNEDSSGSSTLTLSPPSESLKGPSTAPPSGDQEHPQLAYEGTPSRSLDGAHFESLYDANAPKAESAQSESPDGTGSSSRDGTRPQSPAGTPFHGLDNVEPMTKLQLELEPEDRSELEPELKHELEQEPAQQPSRKPKRQKVSSNAQRTPLLGLNRSYESTPSSEASEETLLQRAPSNTQPQSRSRTTSSSTTSSTRTNQPPNKTTVNSKNLADRIEREGRQNSKGPCAPCRRKGVQEEQEGLQCYYPTNTAHAVHADNAVHAVNTVTTAYTLASDDTIHTAHTIAVGDRIASGLITNTDDTVDTATR